MQVKIILACAAIIELLTGALLFIVPELVVRLLFDASLAGTGIIVSRIAGAGLITLAIACWPYALVKGISQGLIAMLSYNCIAAIYLGYLGLFEERVGVLLWPAVAFHFAITIFLFRAIFKR